MISFAAPAVNEVNLYWSGNQTVLRGWASEEGIPRLYQSYKEGSVYGLKMVTVHWTPVGASHTPLRKKHEISHVKQGFEGYERCSNLLEDFTNLVQQRIRKITAKGEGSGLHVKTVPLKGSRAGKSAADGYLTSLTAAGMNSRAPPDHGWIEAMEKFRLVLMKMHEKLPKQLGPERIKVSKAEDV